MPSPRVASVAALRDSQTTSDAASRPAFLSPDSLSTPSHLRTPPQRSLLPLTAAHSATPPFHRKSPLPEISPKSGHNGSASPKKAVSAPLTSANAECLLDALRSAPPPTALPGLTAQDGMTFVPDVYLPEFQPLDDLPVVSVSEGRWSIGGGEGNTLRDQFSTNSTAGGDRADEADRRGRSRSQESDLNDGGDTGRRAASAFVPTPPSASLRSKLSPSCLSPRPPSSCNRSRTSALSRSSFRLRQSVAMETDEMGNTSVGGLVLWRELGAGASATVYLGLDDDEDSAAPPRAVKVVDRSVSRRQGLGVPSPRSRQPSAAFTDIGNGSCDAHKLRLPSASLNDGRRGFGESATDGAVMDGEFESSNQFLTNDESHENENETTETLQEVDVLRTLERHPNIVTLHECIDDPDHDQVYLVMDFVPDGPIAKLDPHTGCCAPLPADDVLCYGQQLAAALAHVHADGIAHGDVKPDNVLIDRAKRHAYLADFGVARRVDSQDTMTSQGTPPFTPSNAQHSSDIELCHEALSRGSSASQISLGAQPTQSVVTTPLFAAPEMLLGAPPSPAADVWAMGVTLYVLLLGRLPFHGSLRELCEVVPSANIPLPKPDELDAAATRIFERVVLPLLAPAADDRPTAAMTESMMQFLANPIVGLRVNTLPSSRVPTNACQRSVSLRCDVPPPLTGPLHATDGVADAASNGDDDEDIEWAMSNDQSFRSETQKGNNMASVREGDADPSFRTETQQCVMSICEDPSFSYREQGSCIIRAFSVRAEKAGGRKDTMRLIGVFDQEALGSMRHTTTSPRGGTDTRPPSMRVV